MKRPLKPCLKAVASEPLTAAALAKMPTVSSKSATSAFCLSARPDQMDPVPTTEADKTSDTSPAEGQRTDVFNIETLPNVENLLSAAMSTGDVCRTQRHRNFSDLPGNVKKHVDKTEEQFEAGDRQAAGGGVKSKKEKETAITEEFFAQQFQNVTSDHISPDFDLKHDINVVIDVLKNSGTVWTQHVTNLKLLRSLMKAGSEQDCISVLPLLAEPLYTAVRCLRSQVVREACITVGYLSTQFGTEFGESAETLLPGLITSLHKSVKVISQSCNVCIRIIIKNTPNANLIPLVTANGTSKSKFIRRGSMEILCQMMCMWPQDMLDKQTTVLQSAITLGINDADSDTRVHGRRTFSVFESRFPICAESLFNSLSTSKQNAIRQLPSGTVPPDQAPSACGSVTSSMSSSVDNYATAKLTKPIEIATVSPSTVSGNECAAVALTSPPQTKNVLGKQDLCKKRHISFQDRIDCELDTGSASQISPPVATSKDDVDNDDLLQTLDSLQKSVFGQASGTIPQRQTQTGRRRPVIAKPVIRSAIHGAKPRADVTEDVLSSLAEIEQMVMFDAGKPDGDFQSYDEPMTKRNASQRRHSCIDNSNDRKCDRLGVDNGGGTDGMKNTSEVETTGDNCQLETPITKFKSKLKPREIPYAVNKSGPKGLSNLVKNTKLRYEGTMMPTPTLRPGDLHLTPTPSSGDVIPPSKKTSSRIFCSRLLSPSVVTLKKSSPASPDTAISRASSNPITQKEEKPTQCWAVKRAPCRKKPWKLLPTKIAGTDKEACVVALDTVNDTLPPKIIPLTRKISDQDCFAATTPAPVPHIRKRWSHSVPCKLKNMATSRIRNNSMTSASASSKQDGSFIHTSDEFAITEDTFVDAYDKIPPIQATSAADLTKRMLCVQRLLVNIRSTPNVIVDSLQRVRALTISCDATSEAFVRHIRKLVPALQTCLRNNSNGSVILEACITIAFVSINMAGLYDGFAEALMPLLVEFLPSESKNNATAAGVCLSIILQHTHSDKVLPAITTHCSSSLKIVRRVCTMYLRNILHDWPVAILEKHATTIIKDTLKQCLRDQDLRTRNNAKEVFREFAIQFPRYADDIVKEQEAEKAPRSISPKREQLGEKLIQTTAKSAQAKRELSEALRDPDSTQQSARSRFGKFIRNNTANGSNATKSMNGKSPVRTGSTQTQKVEEKAPNTQRSLSLQPKSESAPLTMSIPVKMSIDAMRGRQRNATTNPCNTHSLRRPSLIQNDRASAGENNHSHLAQTVEQTSLLPIQRFIRRTPVHTKYGSPPNKRSTEQAYNGSPDRALQKRGRSLERVSQSGLATKSISTVQVVHAEELHSHWAGKLCSKIPCTTPGVKVVPSFSRPHQRYGKYISNLFSKQRAKPASNVPSVSSSSSASKTLGLKSNIPRKRSSETNISDPPPLAKQPMRCLLPLQYGGKLSGSNLRKPQASPKVPSRYVSTSRQTTNEVTQLVFSRHSNLSSNIESAYQRIQWSSELDGVSPSTSDLLSNIAPSLQAGSVESVPSTAKSKKRGASGVASRLPRPKNGRCVSMSSGSSESNSVDLTTANNSTYVCNSSHAAKNVRRSSDSSTANTQMDSFSDGFSSVAHLLTPALLSSLSTLVPAELAEDSQDCRTPSISLVSLTTQTPSAASQVERSLHSPHDKREHARLAENTGEIPLSTFTEQTSQLSDSLRSASDSNTDVSQISSDLSQDLPINERSRGVKYQESISLKTTQMMSEDEHDDGHSSDGSLVSGISQDSIESTNLSSRPDAAQNTTDHLYLNIQLALAKGTFTPKVSSFENPTVRVPMLDNLPRRRGSSRSPSQQCGAPINDETVDVEKHHTDSKLKSYGRWKGSPETVGSASYRWDVGDSTSKPGAVQSRGNAAKPSRLAIPVRNDPAVGDKITMEESYGKHSRNTSTWQFVQLEMPSGDHPICRSNEETVLKQRNYPLTKMFFNEQHQEQGHPTKQRRSRHSSQNAERLSRHSHSVSPAREERVRQNSDKDRVSSCSKISHHSSKQAWNMTRDAVEEPRMGETDGIQVYQSSPASNDKSHVTIQVPGMSPLTRQVEAACESAPDEGSVPTAKVTKGARRSPITVTMVIPLAGKLPKGNTEAGKLSITDDDKDLLTALGGSKSHEIGTPPYSPHQYHERRIGDIHLHHGKTSYDDANDVGDANTEYYDMADANTEYDMAESERNETNEKEKTRADILTVMEKTLVSHIPDKQFRTFSSIYHHGTMACNVPETDDGDSDTSGVVSDVASCLSQEMISSSCQTWSHANSMRRLWADKTRRDNTISSAAIIGYKPRPVIRKTVADSLRKMQSSVWSDRKRGLQSLKTLLNSGHRRLLNSLELRRVMSVMLKMFQEVESTVFICFLEVLCDLLHIYNAQLHGRLDTLLTNILCAVERIDQHSGSCQAVTDRIQKILDTIRVCFPCRLQLVTLINFMLRDKERYTNAVRLVTLDYTHGLTLMLESDDLVGMADLGLLIALLLMWISNQQNESLVQVSEAILIGLYSLSPGIFQKTVLKLPRTFQETLLTLIDEDIKSMHM